MVCSVGACPDKLGSHRRAQVKHAHPARPSVCFSFSSAWRRSATKSSVRKRQKAKQHVRGGIGEDHEAEELVLCKLKSQTWHTIWYSNTFPSKFFFPDGILHISGFSGISQ